MNEIDLSVIADTQHQRLLAGLLAELEHEDGVTGILLAGSLARGDAVPSSDVDLIVLIADGRATEFRSERRGGILVERTYTDEATASRQLTEQPMRVYTYLDGRILMDRAGGLARLVLLARQQLGAYRTSLPEREAIAYWLRSALGKIQAAQDAGDELKAAYWTSTTAWKLLEGLWAARDRPMPPGGAVWAHLSDLDGVTPEVSERLHTLFLGSTPELVAAMVALIGETLPLLDERTASPLPVRMRET